MDLWMAFLSGINFANMVHQIIHGELGSGIMSFSLFLCMGLFAIKVAR